MTPGKDKKAGKPVFIAYSEANKIARNTDRVNHVHKASPTKSDHKNGDFKQ